MLNCLIQKAVRVTTMMKRLRAPDQSDSGASSPALGASGGPVTPSTTPVPLAATPVPPRSTLGSQEHPEAHGEGALVPTRCNGEILTAQQPAFRLFCLKFVEKEERGHPSLFVFVSHA